MHIRYPDFPVEEKAAFRRICSKFGLAEADFDIEAEVNTKELAGWRCEPHVVVVKHLPSLRTRICAGWAKKPWLEIFEEYVRQFRQPAQKIRAIHE